MPKEEYPTPKGYARTDYFICVNIGGHEFALPKSSLEKRFVEAIFDAREVHFEKHVDSGTYEHEVRGPESVSLGQRTGSAELIVWHGIPCMASPEALSEYLHTHVSPPSDAPSADSGDVF